MPFGTHATDRRAIGLAPRPGGGLTTAIPTIDRVDAATATPGEELTRGPLVGSRVSSSGLRAWLGSGGWVVLLALLVLSVSLTVGAPAAAGGGAGAEPGTGDGTETATGIGIEVGVGIWGGDTAGATASETAPPGQSALLETAPPVTLVGDSRAEARTPGGVVHAHGAGVADGAWLEAGTVTVEMAWEEGVRANTQAPRIHGTADTGETTRRFEDATVTFSAFEGIPQLLSLPTSDEGAGGGAQPAVQLSHTSRTSLGTDTSPTSDTSDTSDTPDTSDASEASDTSSASDASDASDVPRDSTEPLHVRVAEDRTLVRAGASDETQDVGESQHVGFWYTVEGPAVETHGPGTLRVTGNFTLFVHNVTIEVDSRWSDWTGYHEEWPGRPVSAYERRITRLTVTDGTLVLQADAPVLSLYDETVDLHVEGVVTADETTGRLPLAERTLVYDRSLLVLEGEIEATAQATSPTSLGVRVAPSQALHAVAAPGVRVLDPSSAEAPDELTWFGLPAPLSLPVSLAPGDASWVRAPGILAGGVFLLVLAAVTGWREGPEALRRWRAWRHERWMDRGVDAAMERDWALAADAFGKAARARPDDPVAWFQGATAELEAGRYEACLDVVEAAREREGLEIDPADLLKFETAAAREAEDAARFEAAFTELADADPMTADAFARRLGFHDELPPSLRRRLASQGLEGPLDGYA